MNFPKSFVRYLGGPIPALGSDANPTTLTLAQQAAYKTLDNVFSCRPQNTSGFPIQRVAMGVAYDGAGSPSAVPIASYVWDDLTCRWFKVQVATAVTLDINSITFVDVPSLLDFPNTSLGAVLAPVGALEIALVPGFPTTHPDGTYTFVVGADVSNPGV
jgi:hypothetical protein